MWWMQLISVAGVAFDVACEFLLPTLNTWALNVELGRNGGSWMALTVNYCHFLLLHADSFLVDCDFELSFGVQPALNTNNLDKIFLAFSCCDQRASVWSLLDSTVSPRACLCYASKPCGIYTNFSIVTSIFCCFYYHRIARHLVHS